MRDSKSDHQATATEWAVASTWPAHREDIRARYFELLTAEHSPLLQAGPEVRTQMEAQLFAVIDEAADEPAEGSPTADVSSRIGRARAASGIHPSVSLAAAQQIFVAALPSLTCFLEERENGSAAATAAVSLNAAILNRMADAAANYVGYLLDRADKAHREEALRLSRELHDTVGPSIAAAVQSLDLANRYHATDSRRAEAKLRLARETLVEAATDLRALAAETRVTVDPGGLAQALTNHVSNLPDHLHGTVSTQGALDDIPSHYEREVFLILREAIRNAALHSKATEISVNLAVEGIHLSGSVHDNGAGFNANDTKAGGTGMESMRERAAILGAALNVATSPNGTKVSLTVPLPNRTTP